MVEERHFSTEVVLKLVAVGDRGSDGGRHRRHGEAGGGSRRNQGDGSAGARSMVGGTGEKEGLVSYFFMDHVPVTDLVHLNLCPVAPVVNNQQQHMEDSHFYVGHTCD